jgi:hypothetical protein
MREELQAEAERISREYEHAHAPEDRRRLQDEYGSVLDEMREESEKPKHYGFLVTVYVRKGMELDSYSGLANADELGATVGELVASAQSDGAAILSVSTERR